MLAILAFLSSPLSAVAQDNGDLVVIGKRVFNKCSPCHLVGDAKIAKMGAPLNDLFGRKPGSVPGFEYSPAMIAFGQNHVWDEATLTSFVKDSQAVVPGGKMQLKFTKDTEIQALLAYLATFDPEGMAAK
jgi:cytochrome c